MSVLVGVLRMGFVFLYCALFCMVLTMGGKASILMAVGLISIPLSVVKPQLFFAFFIVARPLADLSAKTSVLGLNPASWITLVFIAFCIKDFVTTPREEYEDCPQILRIFNRYFAVLIFTYLPSFLLTSDLKVSIMDVVRLFSSAVAINYVIRKFYNSEEDVNFFCKMVLTSSVIPLGMGFYQWASHTGRFIEGYNRIFGTFTHPNVFAEYLLFVFFVGLYTFRFVRLSRFGRLACGALMLAVLFCLSQTYTRTIWIAFAMCFFLFAAVQREAKVRTALFLFIAGTALVAFPMVLSRFDDILNAPKDRDSSLEWRFNLWKKTIGGIQEHPYFGGGLGMYEHRIGVMAHNDILRMSYETGLIGTALYLFGFIFLVYYALRELRLARDDLARQSRLQIAVCLILGFLISSVADNMLRSTVIMFYYLTTVMLFLAPNKARIVS